MLDSPPFRISGALYPRSPVVISVGHAGRDYPAGLLDMARVPLEALQGLEDRHADAIVAIAAGEGATTIIASMARAMIDLNRDPREIDPVMMDRVHGRRAIIQTQKVRGGLGLVPRRLASCGELWRRRLTEEELDLRLNTVHVPYHQAIAEALRSACTVFGGAILIDCHSMPPLPARGGARTRIVLGDRFGKSATRDLMDAATGLIAASGLQVGRNQPYAGGYTLERHGNPTANIHAIQIEYDRTLYMDAGGEPIAADVAVCGRLLADLALELGGIVSRDLQIAAE